jgi:hypothetical protein
MGLSRGQQGGFNVPIFEGFHTAVVEKLPAEDYCPEDSKVALFGPPPTILEAPV